MLPHVVTDIPSTHVTEASHQQFSIVDVNDDIYAYNKQLQKLPTKIDEL
eukprot:SAG31_NODE_34_length_31842_cov_31.677850_15_plen_49_part_00